MKKHIMALAALVALVTISGAQAATTTIVATPVANTVGNAAFVPGFESSSWQAGGSAKAEYYVTPQALFGRDVTIGELASISYWTNKSTGHSGSDPADWYLAVYTEVNNSLPNHGSWYGKRINSEPYFAQALTETPGTWTQWTSSGPTNKLRFYDSTNNLYFGSYSDGFLADLTSGSLANEKIQLISMQTGSAWANGFTGLLDGLRIETSNGDIGQVNFEAIPEPAFFQMGALIGMSGLGLLRLRRRSA